MYTAAIICLLLFNFFILYLFLLQKRKLKSLKNELNDTINNIKEESIFLDNKLKELIHLKIEESETSLKNRLETSIRIISKRLDKRVEEK